jgi:hypothetical protein
MCLGTGPGLHWSYDQPYHIVWACLDANAASGAELVMNVKDSCLAVHHLVDLVRGSRIHGVELECVYGARDHTIVTTGTTFHVYVHCKCHGFTHQLSRLKIDYERVVK